MFGWEFPPYVTGGLGTACFGLTQELSKVTDRILFVIPKATQPVVMSSDPGQALSVLNTPKKQGLEVTSASSNGWAFGPTDPFGTPHGGETTQTFEGSLVTKVINSPLQPYQSALGYGQIAREWSLAAPHGESPNPSSRLPGSAGHSRPGTPPDPRQHNASLGQDHTPHSMFTNDDLYGANLFSEVARYSTLATRVALTEPFDVIHAHDWMTFPAALAAKQITGRPLVVHVHALEFDRSGDNIDQRVYDIERRGMHEADMVVAVSSRTRNTIIERYGVCPARVRVVHNGVMNLPDHLPIRRPPVFDEKIVVFLGRITMQKGPEYFIEAARRVALAFPNVRFVMAGIGDMLPRMIVRSAQLRLNKHFHFTGFVGEEQRAALLAQADLFVMTSVSEPFGLTPVEAAQHQVPLIIPHQSGVAEILRHAIKIDFWDIDRIADAMIHVLSNPKIAQHMASQTKADLQSATWGHAARKVRELYQEVV
jgi:glycogen(starch) synthase